MFLDQSYLTQQTKLLLVAFAVFLVVELVSNRVHVDSERYQVVELYVDNALYAELTENRLYPDGIVVDSYTSCSAKEENLFTFLSKVCW